MTWPLSVGMKGLRRHEGTRLMKLPGAPKPPKKPQPPRAVAFAFEFRAIPKANKHKIAQRGGGRFARRMVVNDLTGAVAKNEESLVTQALIRVDLKDRDFMPWSCPIDAEVDFVYAVPESWDPWKREAALKGEWLHVESPDMDNSEKLLWDALEGVFYVNDKQVREKRVRKTYGPADRLIVTLTPRVQAAPPPRAPRRKPT